MAREKHNPKPVDYRRRKFIAIGAVGAVAAASAAGYAALKAPSAPVSSNTSNQNPGDPTFDANGVQLPSLTSDPPHREGSIYFRSDLLQMRLDDGKSYFTLPKQQLFSKGGSVLGPVAQTIVIWRAPFSCTVTAVKGYQDAGNGSVVTAYVGSADILNSDISISTAGTWQDGGSLATTAVSAGESIAIKIVSVSGSPNYITVQVEFTQP
jgi:hypothetical protein